MLKRILTFLSVLILLTGVAAGWLYQRTLSQLELVLNVAQTQFLEVEKGSSGYRVIAALQQRGWVEDSRLIKLLFRLRPELSALKAGEYQVEPQTTLGELLAKLVSGDVVQHQFTLVEGSTVTEILARLASDDRLKHTLTAAGPEQLAVELGMQRTSAEGLFLAETYHFQRGMTDRELLLRASEALDQLLAAAWVGRAPALPLESPYQALILASIVEKETGVDAERAEISGVFIRRLLRGMRLQTDPTVIYGLGERYQGNLTRKHLREATAYNTYVIRGLPPTPIASVGAEAIQAALHPADGKALFFVARGDGTHQFSDTLEQHNRAVREYQLQRRQDYRSSPEANR